MLGSAFRAQDITFQEGFVTYVDVYRSICTVTTLSGQFFPDVRWLNSIGSVNGSPNVGDKVLIHTGLTYPTIIGQIPIQKDNNANSINNSMLGGGSTPDLGGPSSLGNDTILDSGRPVDQLNGDKILASSGSSIGVLNTGSVLIKASFLSQIILTKLGNLCRIVARNYQRISDASGYVSASVLGRVYSWFGADKDFYSNKAGLSKYNEVIGDVAAGEVLRGNPFSGASLPTTDSRVKKEWLNNDSGIVMSNTLLDDGSVELIVNNQSKLRIFPDKIEVNFSDTSIAVFQSDKASITYGDNSEMILTSDSSTLRYNTHSISVTTSGIRVS